MAGWTQYNYIWWCLSVTYTRLMVFFMYSFSVLMTKIVFDVALNTNNNNKKLHWIHNETILTFSTKIFVITTTTNIRTKVMSLVISVERCNKYNFMWWNFFITYAMSRVISYRAALHVLRWQIRVALSMGSCQVII